jgi:hypothetical protein
VGRVLLVLLATLLVAVQIARNAAVAALADTSPDAVARIWPGHPAAEIAWTMTQIGRAARQRSAIAPAVYARMDDAAVHSPLSPQPFLVRGVQAQLAGETELSTSAFLAAERRDPRSLPAHYFLADQYFRSGDAREGLREAAALARLAPGGITSVAPYVAAYAKDPATWPQLREIFAANPDLEDVALAALATNAANTDAVMALADDRHRAPKSAWVPRLLGSLVEVGEYAKARAIWSKLAGVQAVPAQTVYDAGFADSTAPPPFNWELMSSPVGLAERQPGGRLHVIFYGQQDGLLARQLLVLPAGRYRLTMSKNGSQAGGRALNWSLRCDRTQTPFAAISLDRAATGPWTFAVPANCAAQWLELSGVSSDVAQQSDVTISGLKLLPERPNG